MQSPEATSASLASEALSPGGDAMLWKGSTLRGDDPALATQLDILGKCLALAQCASASAPCGPENCERHNFVVPEGNALSLVVGLRWPSIDPVWMALWIEDESGAIVAEGRSTTIDHNGASAIVENARPGRYDVVVSAMWGTSDHEVAARLVPIPPTPAAPRDLLPDIKTLPPTDLRFADPPGHFIANALVLPTNPIARAIGAQHCSTDEASAGARLCLRFTNAVANVGEGALDVALTPVAGATHAAGGRFVQRIHSTAGTVRESPAGAAEFHAIHGHWHNAGSNAFQVYAFDLGNATRGEAVAAGRKTGMCFADVGIVDPAWAGLTLPAHGGVQCFNPAIDGEWSMGLAVGWYDAYPWMLNDQYVDMAGVPDGTYLLCSVANSDGFLEESDLSNNEGCTAFRLAEGGVETLDPLPYHAAP